MFFIRSYHRPDGDTRPRVHFWQTPWLAPIADEWRPIGGWVTFSGNATKYDDQREAEAVNAWRALDGEVVDATKYLQVGQ